MDSTSKIFDQPGLNESLTENGFVVIPFLNEDEVETLLDIFNTEKPNPPAGFYATTHDADAGFKTRMSDTIKNQIARAVSEQLNQVSLLGGAFISKSPGKKSTLPLHQDWNIVDESRHRSFNIWIPLVDVTAENGAVMVLKGSHAKIPTFRGPNLPPILSKVSDAVLAEMTTLPMTKGSALIYDHALWHASPENKTTNRRPAVVVGMTEQDVEMTFYYKIDEDIQEYRATPDFYLKGNPNQGPQGLEKLRLIEDNQEQLDLHQFYKIYMDSDLPKSMTSDTLISKISKSIKWVFGSS
jgi:hypothetical protein